MSALTEPCEANSFLADHAALLIGSFRQLTGRELLPGVPQDPVTAARQLWEAPVFVSSHDGAPDPVLNYGNRTALALFGMDWEGFTSTPSRFTAEPENRDERAAMLARAARDGFIDDYSGVRLAGDGRRFRIESATIWNVTDASGARVGQAATFARWETVESG
jgi:hypothetical protein